MTRWSATDNAQIEFVARALYAGILFGGRLEDWDGADGVPEMQRKYYWCIAQDAIEAINYYNEEIK